MTKPVLPECLRKVICSYIALAKSQRSMLCLVTAIFFNFLIVNSTSAQVLRPGMDAVITMYSDTPLTRPVAIVKRIGDPIGAGAPLDVASNPWVAGSTTIPITSWDAKTMGQVFGTAIDNTGNVYFGATRVYYPNGANYTCLSLPTLPAAGISDGAFHGVGQSFGLIYKASASALNTVNCIVTASSTIAGAGVGTSKIYNTGYGIGNVAYSTVYNKLYASNLEDGMIYCINPVSGNIDFVFDPLGPDNGTSGYVPYGERVIAVAVNNEFNGTTRLYYSVLLSNVTGCQNVIRSVLLTAGGNFAPATDVLEINIPLSPPQNCVTDIAFSVRSEMLVAEKGDPHNAHVYQYYGHHNAWSVPQDLPVSNFNLGMHNANGGVDYGYMKKNSGELVCDSLVWSTENAMDNVKWYGIQSMPHNGFAPFVGSGFAPQAYVVDLDGLPGNSPYYQKGRFGDVEVFDSSCGAGPTDICALVSINAVKDTGSCCYNIFVSNKYHDGYFTSLNIATNHLNIDNVTAGSTWGGITYRTGQSVSFGDTSHLWYMPKDTGVTGGFLLARICVSGYGPDVIRATWIGNAPQFDTICKKETPIDGCAIPVDTNCVGLFNQKAICEGGVVKMQFQIKNNSGFTMRSVTMHAINPDVKPVNSFYPIADLPPGATSPVYTVSLVVKNGATNGCFFFSACDLNVFPGTSGLYPKFCCMDSIQYCVEIPHCDSCDAISITAEKNDPVKCCYKLTLTNNLLGTTISCLRFNGLSGTQFAVFSGWNIQAPVSSNKITICAPGTGLGNGIYPDFANFCITGTSTAPYGVSVDFLDKEGKVICTKQLSFQDCELVKPTCANIVNDSMYCDGNKTRYSFSIKNNSTFPLYQVDLRLSDTSFKLDKYLVIPDTPILPGDMAGPYLVTIDSSTEGNKTFCMYLTGHNNIYIPDSVSATLCCTDSMGVICLPYVNCDSTCCTSCCEFANLVIPSGITPNHDAFNEMLVIQNAALCSGIKIVVYNRWGNIVYREDHYQNNWEGTNMKGETLPQGTYFVVVELPNGSKKGTYIDIRY